MGSERTRSFPAHPAARKCRQWGGGDGTSRTGEGLNGIPVGQSKPGRITLEGIRLDPSGWDPTGSNQTGLDGAEWAGRDPNRSNWTGEDETEQGRMGSEPENIRASVGFRVIPVPLQMEAAGLCSQAVWQLFPWSRAQNPTVIPLEGLAQDGFSPVPLLPCSGLHPGRACIPQASIGISSVPEAVLHIDVLKSDRETWFSLALLLWVPVALPLPFIYM